MPIKTEADAVVAARAYLKAKGVYSIKLAAGPYQVAGLPDTVCCVRGRFVAVEFKKVATANTTPSLTEKQLLHLEHVRDAGGEALVLAYVTKDESWVLYRLMRPMSVVTVPASGEDATWAGSKVRVERFMGSLKEICNLIIDEAY